MVRGMGLQLLASFAAALAAAGCVGPSRHPKTDSRWLVEGTARASAALPASRSEERSLRVAVYGDCRGSREAHRAVAAAIRAEKPDLVIFTGDAIDCYPTGHMPDLGFGGYLVPFWPQKMRGYPLFSLTTLIPFPQAIHETLLSLYHPVRDPNGWNGFLEDTAPLRVGDRVPFLFVPGNHDLYHRFDRETVASLFGEPGGNGGHEPSELQFYVDARGVRFVVLNTGDDLLGDPDPVAPDGPQLRWLDRVLAEAAARGLLAVVAFHRPACSSAAEDPVDPEIRDGIGNILARRGVPLALCGHAHAYERIDRPRSGGATTYLITGGAGAPFHHEVPPPRRDPGSRVFVEETLHYVLLEIGPRGVRGRAVAVPRPGSGDTPRTLDSFEIPR